MSHPALPPPLDSRCRHKRRPGDYRYALAGRAICPIYPVDHACQRRPAVRARQASTRRGFACARLRLLGSSWLLRVPGGSARRHKPTARCRHYWRQCQIKKPPQLDGVLETYFLLQLNRVLMQSRSSAPKPRHLVPAKHFYGCVFLVSPAWTWGKPGAPKSETLKLVPARMLLRFEHKPRRSLPPADAPQLTP
jgi:hypothetical protein